MILRSISVPKWLLTLDSCISPSTGRNQKAVCQMTECIQEHYSSSTCQSINHKVLANGKLFLPSKRSNLPVIGSATVSLCLHTPWVKSSVNIGVRKGKGLNVLDSLKTKPGHPTDSKRKKKTCEDALLVQTAELMHIIGPTIECHLNAEQCLNMSQHLLK